MLGSLYSCLVVSGVVAVVVVAVVVVVFLFFSVLSTSVSLPATS